MNAMDLLALTIIAWASKEFREAIYNVMSFEDWSRAYYVQIDCVMFA